VYWNKQVFASILLGILFSILFASAIDSQSDEEKSIASIPFIQPASAHVSDVSLTGFGTPTIDGVIGTAEWSAASTVAITVNLPTGGTTPGTLYAMNDQNNLYLAVDYKKRAFSSVNDQVSFQFDNDHAGGARVNCDDSFFLNTKQNPNTFFDTVRTTDILSCPDGGGANFEPLDTTVDGTNDGSGAVTNDGTKTMFEFSHPLNSGDVNDFSLTDTSTVGFHVRIGLKDPGNLQTVFPSTANIFSTENYADIVIKGLTPPPEPEPAPPSKSVYGELKIEKENYEIPYSGTTQVKLFGTVGDSSARGNKITLTRTNPEGDREELSVIPSKHGYFENYFIFDRNSLLGIYEVEALTSEGSFIGKISFQLYDKNNPIVSTKEPEPAPPPSISKEPLSTEITSDLKCEQLVSVNEVKSIIGYTDELKVSSYALDPTKLNEPPFERGCNITFQELKGLTGFTMSVFVYDTDDQAKEKYEKEWSNVMLYDISTGESGSGSSSTGSDYQYNSWKVNDNEVGSIHLLRVNNHFVDIQTKITEGMEPLVVFDDLSDLSLIVQSNIFKKMGDFGAASMVDVPEGLKPTRETASFPSGENLESALKSVFDSEVCKEFLSVDEVKTAIGYTGELESMSMMFPPSSVDPEMPGLEYMCVISFVKSQESAIFSSIAAFDSAESAIETFTMMSQNMSESSISEIKEDMSETGWKYLSAEMKEGPAKGFAIVSYKDRSVVSVAGSQSEGDEPLADLPQLHEVTKIVWGKIDTKISTVSEPVKERVPSWIKNNAKWWSEGTIGENDFVGGIQYLIKEKIIDIPDLPEQASTIAEQEIPDWIKNNAGWWADGLISEDDFVNGIKYLVEQGIIKV